LSSDDLLQALCLENDELASPVAENSTHRETGEEGGSPNSNLRQATADMLLTYQREVDDSGGALEELRKHMEAAQEIWELGLDTTRNRIIQANLMMSMATLSMSL
jgi:molybdopterin converting factor small subunit